MASLSDTLRLQAAAGHGESLDTARCANDFQSRTRAATRRMMATISELSMYQVRAHSQMDMSAALQAASSCVCKCALHTPAPASWTFALSLTA